MEDLYLDFGAGVARPCFTSIASDMHTGKVDARSVPLAPEPRSDHARTDAQRGDFMRVPLGVQLGWGTILKRTGQEMVTDGCFGMAAQLAYYFFLSLFPALLIAVALTSFFSSDVLDQMVRWLGTFTPPDVLTIIQGQLQQIRGGGHVSLLTFGVLGALWSSSSAMSAIIDTLNRAYGIKEGRPWWKTQLLAIVLTIVLSLFVMISFTLVVGGPEIAEKLAMRIGLGQMFAWTWKVLQWPVVFLLVSEGFALVYFLAPDAEQLWPWILPGAHLATLLWLLISIGFRLYVTHFGQYNKMYGAIGAAIVLLLWFYLSGLVLLFGAELNSEIEHASPYGKAEGEKVPGERRHWLFRIRRHGGIGETPDPEHRAS
jgi:membrane protein